MHPKYSREAQQDALTFLIREVTNAYGDMKRLAAKDNVKAAMSAQTAEKLAKVNEGLSDLITSIAIDYNQL